MSRLFVKVGMELYMQEGPDIVRKVKEQGHDIFLDLKLHDIPNTVKSAMKGLARLGVDLVNVHAAGGKNMMEGALEGLEAGTPAGKRRASLNCSNTININDRRANAAMNNESICHYIDSVLHYAQLTKEAGLKWCCLFGVMKRVLLQMYVEKISYV